MNERQIFEEALAIADPARRKVYLDQACSGDADIRSQVESLLTSHVPDSQFLEIPVAEQLREDDFEHGGGASGRFTGRIVSDKESEPVQDAPVGPDLSFLSPSKKPGSLGSLGHYEILQVLGQGGFGIVFKAFDEKLHRIVAIKVMNSQLAATSPPRKRFLREARAAAAIRHENVIRVHSVDEQPLPYFVMEYVDGQTLQQKLDTVGPLEIAEILDIGRQIASGLAAAHSLGLIHRDIKPSNILLEQGARQKVQITDFGLARAADDASLTRTGDVSGTPLFMSPEQATASTIDHRTDLFSVGSVLYIMASGRPPFRASNVVAVLKRLVEETPRSIKEINPDVPDWLCQIIAKLHAKHPQDRFQTATEVANLLSRCQADLHRVGCVETVPELTRQTTDPVSRTTSPNGATRSIVPSAGFGVNLILIITAAVFTGLGLAELVGRSWLPQMPLRQAVLYEGRPLSSWLVQLNDVSPESRAVAAQAITAIGARDDQVVPALTKILESGRDPELCRNSADILAGIGPQAGIAVSALRKGLRAKEWRENAVRAIEKIGAPATEAVPALAESITDDDPNFRSAAAVALEAIDPKGIIRVPNLKQRRNQLTTAAADADFFVRRAAIRLLAQLGPEAECAAPVLVKALKANDVEIRSLARQTLLKIGKPAVTELLTASNDPTPSVRKLAIEILSDLGAVRKDLMPILGAALKDDDNHVRESVVSALRKLEPPFPEIAAELVAYFTKTQSEEAADLVLNAGAPAIPHLIALLANESLLLLKQDPSLGVEAQGLSELLRKVVLENRNNLVAKTLARFGPVAVPALLEATRSDNPFVCYWATWSLGEIGPCTPNPVPRLTELLKHSSVEVRTKTVLALRPFKDQAAGAIPELLNLIKNNPSPHNTIEVLRTLREIGPVAADAVPLLITLTRDMDYQIRKSAIWTLVRIDISQSVPALIAGMREAYEFRWGIAESLKDLHDLERIMPTLRDVFNEHPEDREGILFLTHFIGSPAFPMLRSLLQSDDPAIRSGTADALVHNVEPATDAVIQLRVLVKDPNAGVRRAALCALARIQGMSASPELFAAIADSDAKVREYSLVCLYKVAVPNSRLGYVCFGPGIGSDNANKVPDPGTFNTQAFIAHFHSALSDSDKEVRKVVVDTLERMEVVTSIPHLLPVLEQDPEFEVREAAALALSKLYHEANADREAIAAVMKSRLADPSPYVRYEAAKFFEKHGSKDHFFMAGASKLSEVLKEIYDNNGYPLKEGARDLLDEHRMLVNYYNKQTP